MESKAKILGHPIHPMLIVFPAGLFFSAVISDILFLITHSTIFPTASFIMIAGGVIGGLIAAIFGFRDWLAIPGGTRAKSVGAFHGVGNVVVVVLFLISWLIRREAPGYTPSALALVFSFVGVVIVAGTAWLGGELVDRLGVGVDPGANLDAPSSLSNQPAGTHVQGVGTYAQDMGHVQDMGSLGSVPVTGEDKDDIIDEP